MYAYATIPSADCVMPAVAEAKEGRKRIREGRKYERTVRARELRSIEVPRGADLRVLRKDLRYAPAKDLGIVISESPGLVPSKGSVLLFVPGWPAGLGKTGCAMRGVCT